ncbi:MAG: hypothetical protein LHW48_01610 [Candidatus Cloacimonetes bacterium]|nr:hypothetical protein [Candidatus Cloacimonadota bacterium]
MKFFVIMLFTLVITTMAFAYTNNVGNFSLVQWTADLQGDCVIGYNNLTNNSVETIATYSLVSRKMVGNSWENYVTHFQGETKYCLSPYEEANVNLFSLSKLRSYKPRADFKNGNLNLYYFMRFSVYEKIGGEWIKSSYDNWEVPAF